MEGSESEIILVCDVCGGRTVLAGPLEVWRSASTTFGCECGGRLTLADRPDSGESNKEAGCLATHPAPLPVTGPPTEEKGAGLRVPGL